MHTWILVCLISWFTYACCLWGSFYRREKNRGKVPQGLGVVGVLYSTTCVSYYRHTTTTKHAAAALTIAHNQPHHDESVLVAVLPTHANRRASSDGAGRAPPTDASRLAWVGRNGCQNPSVRAAMWGRRAPSLSLVEFHFIVRLYYVYVINLYIIRLPCSLGGRCFWIRAMAGQARTFNWRPWSTMCRVTSFLSQPLNRRIDSPWRSPTFVYPLHPLLLHLPCPPSFGWLLRPITLPSKNFQSLTMCQVSSFNLSITEAVNW